MSINNDDDSENLAEALRQERAQEGVFQGLDFHYVEVANLLLKGCVPIYLCCACMSCIAESSLFLSLSLPPCLVNRHA